MRAGNGAALASGETDADAGRTTLGGDFTGPRCGSVTAAVRRAETFVRPALGSLAAVSFSFGSCTTGGAPTLDARADTAALEGRAFGAR